MDKSILINKTINNINKLPASKVKEVNDFVEFLLNRIDDQVITEGIQEIASTSKSFDFLNNEPDLYTVSDLKINYTSEKR
jgi:hypothetical protein